jgi:hypothetical protein
MHTFMGNIVTYINCGMNKRLHRSWHKITGVFTFTIGTGTTLIYAQALRVSTNLEHAIFKASTAPVRFQVFYPLYDWMDLANSGTLHVKWAVLSAPSSYCVTSLGKPPSFLKFLLLIYWQFIAGAVLLLHPSFCCIPWVWPTQSDPSPSSMLTSSKLVVLLHFTMKCNAWTYIQNLK